METLKWSRVAFVYLLLKRKLWIKGTLWLCIPYFILLQHSIVDHISYSIFGNRKQAETGLYNFPHLFISCQVCIHLKSEAL